VWPIIGCGACEGRLRLVARVFRRRERETFALSFVQFFVNFSPVSSRAALKEWAISAESLAQGRQVLLLRKGGLLDEDGAFQLEHSAFYFLPTWFHQERALVKAEHQDLWELAPREEDETAKVAYLRHFGQVEEVWRLRENAESALQNAAHIYSQSYLDTRFGYQEEKPLLCAAIRVWTLEKPIRYPLREHDLGCKSWVEWDAPLEACATLALSKETFARNLQELRAILAPVSL